MNQTKIFALLFALSASAVGVTQTSTAWSDPATWGGQVPRIGDKVVIPKGKILVLDVATAGLRGLTIEGTLSTSPNKNVAITSDFIIVKGGKLQIGTAAAPHLGRATITLTGNTTWNLPETFAMGSKVLGVVGGSLEIFGAPVNKNWTKLAADAKPGTTTIKMAEAPGWRVGDQIILATSTRKMGEYDLATVSAINGADITLKAPLKFKHLGTVRSVAGQRLDVRAEVGLLSHNVVVQGDTQSTSLKIGGHAMFMRGGNMMSGPAPTIQIAHAEFRRMGQLNVVGRYPIHFHLLGKTKDCFVRNTSVRDTIQRGIVLHDVQNVSLTGNVVFNTVGHNIVVETNDTKGNVIDGNLALVNRPATPLQTESVFVEQADRLPSNFWMRAADNQVTNNHSAGSFDSGFNFDGVIDSAPFRFTKNTAHAAMGLESAGAGDFDLAAGMMILASNTRPPNDDLSDNLVYHNSIGMWPEEGGVFVIDRLLSVDNDLHTENRGVGNSVTYRNPLFVGRLTETRDSAGPAVHFQYGSDVRLESPTFASYANSGFAAFTELALPTQGNLWVSNPKFIGPKPWVSIGDDQTTTYLDDAFLPRGTYVYGPEYALPGSARVFIGIGDEGTDAFRMDLRPDYSELDVRNMAAPTVGIHQSQSIRRQDGLTYASGMFGYPVILGGAVKYEVPVVAPKGYALRINNNSTFAPAGESPSAMVEVAVSVAALPRGVYRTNDDYELPGKPTTAGKLRAATSRADFLANPETTFLWDAAKKTITTFAARKWVVIVP